MQSGETPLLIATDVAARGLDIDDVEVVINYSFPLVRLRTETIWAAGWKFLCCCLLLLIYSPDTLPWVASHTRHQTHCHIGIFASTYSASYRWSDFISSCRRRKTTCTASAARGVPARQVRRSQRITKSCKTIRCDVQNL